MRVPRRAHPGLFDHPVTAIDVDQLAGNGPLVAFGRLQAEASQAAQPDSSEDSRDRRQGPVEDLGDLRAGEPQPSQRGDRLDGAFIGAIGHHDRRRGPIHSPEDRATRAASRRAAVAGLARATQEGLEVMAVTLCTFNVNNLYVRYRCAASAGTTRQSFISTPPRRGLA